MFLATKAKHGIFLYPSQVFLCLDLTNMSQHKIEKWLGWVIGKLKDSRYCVSHLTFMGHGIFLSTLLGFPNDLNRNIDQHGTRVTSSEKQDKATKPLSWSTTLVKLLLEPAHTGCSRIDIQIMTSPVDARKPQFTLQIILPKKEF